MKMKGNIKTLGRIRDTRYKIVTTWEEIKEVVKYCKASKYASIDFETTGVEYYNSSQYPTVLGISFQIGSSYVIPLDHFSSPFKGQTKKILRYIGKHILEDTSIVKIAHNMKFEAKWLKRYKVKMMGRLFDTMLAKYLLDEERPHGLKDIVAYLIPSYDGYEDEVDTARKKYGGWDKIPLEELAPYNAMDTDVTLRLMFFFEKKLIQTGFYSLFRNMLMMAHRVLTDSEFVGMPVNRAYLQDMTERYAIMIQENEVKLKAHKSIKGFEKWRRTEHIEKLILSVNKEIDALDKTKPNYERMVRAREEKISRYISGILTTKKELITPFNLDSPNQVVQFFFTSPKGLRMTPVKYTKDKVTKKETNRPSTDEEALLIMQQKDKSGFIEQLLKHRELSKLYSVNMKGMLSLLSEKDRIHTHYHIHGTVTGRLSSSEPNMQNIPRCVDADTLIPTSKGVLRIGDIIPDTEGFIKLDKSILVTSHLENYQPITHAINKGIQEMFEIELEDGTTFKCTKHHRLLTEYGWMELGDILLNPEMLIIKYETESRSY